MLVAGTAARAESPQAAIAIARSLADRNEQVALVDLAKAPLSFPGSSTCRAFPALPTLRPDRWTSPTW
ncbi:hypothetical protein AUC68_12920 [Methyloceanibacter methanicus]|uniref:Uncharacterized protein n=1 Tax=Methyloceanibacter methanicus TaxID=1774968 RepID=A0A1E3W6X0_9HYPH|nr:hypothetical protein AUC68_12920 [Methyloceanibacter methanicus]